MTETETNRGMGHQKNSRQIVMLRLCVVLQTMTNHRASGISLGTQLASCSLILKSGHYIDQIQVSQNRLWCLFFFNHNLYFETIFNLGVTFNTLKENKNS